MVAVMQKETDNNGGINEPRKLGMPSHTMPTLGDILKNKTSDADAPIQDPGKKEFVSQMVEKISRSADEDFSSEVPSFNLGRQILAQQRKIATFKRKSPSSPILPNKPLPVTLNIMPIQPISQAPASPQQKIIAEIIAREIQTLTAIGR
jgi:hypothetical protein